LLWDLFPLAVSLAISATFIIRSVVFIGGRRFYVLFDDEAISLTYARNLAHGNGLVWMVGQPHVEGYSNFLWTLWMVAIELAGPSDRMVGLWVIMSAARRQHLSHLSDHPSTGPWVSRGCAAGWTGRGVVLRDRRLVPRGDGDEPGGRPVLGCCAMRPTCMRLGRGPHRQGTHAGGCGGTPLAGRPDPR
jgi:hypothetical protein